MSLHDLVPFVVPAGVVAARDQVCDRRGLGWCLHVSSVSAADIASGDASACRAAFGPLRPEQLGIALTASVA